MRISGYSETTLRKKADEKDIRSVRDPAGRRWLLRRDVERLATQRQDNTLVSR